jgi:hypothetical protein
MPPTSRAGFLLWIIFVVSLGAASPLEAQAMPTRMVIGSNVVCRTEPNPSAPIAQSYLLGDIIAVSRESRQNGEDWYFDQWRVSGQSPACWVYGPLTAEFDRSDPEPALIAVAGHVLQRTDPVRFEDYVEVDNLLTYNFSSVLASSGLLQFRRLSIIERAVSLPTAEGRLVARNPLMRSWFLSHSDLLKYFEPASRWFLQPETYWSLYDKYDQEPWAEELAWAAAQLWIPGDECYSNCILQAVSRTFQQYWTRLPNGASINEAIEKAASRAKYALQMACYDSPLPRPLFDQMRTSLTSVTAPGKPEILGFLDKLEQAQQKCPH